MIWQRSHRFDPRALPLADRHYNRRKVGSPQFVPPGRNIVLLTPDADALRLRVALGQEPELRCPHCGEWWSLTPDCWRLNDWAKCLACLREKARLYSLLRSRDAQYRTAQADKSRRYRAWLKATCPQYLPAYERERSAARREYARARRARLRDAA